jgi:hypothetical protein
LEAEDNPIDFSSVPKKYEEKLQEAYQEELGDLMKPKTLTLKTDVKQHLTQMSRSDFQELLNVFREEEKGQKQNTPNNQQGKRLSLWETVENKRQSAKVKSLQEYPKLLSQ